MEPCFFGGERAGVHFLKFFGGLGSRFKWFRFRNEGLGLRVGRWMFRKTRDPWEEI